MKSLISCLLLFLVLISWHPVSSAETPGIALTITEDSINAFLNSTFSYWNNNQPSVVLDEGSYMISSVNVSNITLTKVNVSPANQDFFNVTDNYTVIFSATGVNIDLSMHVKGKVMKVFSLDRDATISLKGCSISFITTFVCTDANVLEPNVSNFTINYDSLSTNMDGFTGKFLGFLVNMGIRFWGKNLRESISNSSQEIIQNTLNNWLKRTNPSVKIPETPLSVNLAFTSCPAINSDFISFPFDGTVFDSSKLFTQPTLPEPSALPTIDPDVAKSNIQLFVSDYFFESALYAYENSGYLTYTLTPELAAENNIALDTTSLDAFIPNLSKQFGTDAKVQISCTASSDNGLPAVALGNEQIIVALPSTCKLQVISADGSSIEDAVEAVNLITIGLALEIVNSTLHGEIVELDVSQLTITTSTVTAATPAQVTKLLNTIMADAIPSINSQLLADNAGINIGPNATITTVTSSIKDGYFEVFGTPLYSSIVPKLVTNSSTIVV